MRQNLTLEGNKTHNKTALLCIWIVAITFRSLEEGVGEDPLHDLFLPRRVSKPRWTRPKGKIHVRAMNVLSLSSFETSIKQFCSKG